MMLGNLTSLSTNFISFSLIIPNKLNFSSISNLSSSSSHFCLPFRNSCSLTSSQKSQLTQFRFCTLFHKRCDILCAFALKKRRKDGGAMMDMSDFDEDDEFDDWDDEDEGEGEGEGDEDDEEMMFLPFGKMQKWLENKPRGFGEGKVFDTSIEDKLLEEMQQSKLAQVANVNNLKQNPIKPDSMKDHQKKKEIELVPGGIRVRVVNLPKKKNVHRDLKAAFKVVPGIINIVPAVSGNKKTKDPICKGFAFVDFKSEEDAVRFVRQFSKQNIAFGKIQKQIKCEMPNSHSSISSDDESMGNFYSSPPHALEEEFNNDFDIDDSSSRASVSDLSDDTDNEALAANLSNVTVDVLEPAVGSFPSKKRNKNSKKKNIAEGSGEKILKLDIPGSAKRLKIKEKALLMDVFTKYGSQAVLASRDES